MAEDELVLPKSEVLTLEELYVSSAFVRMGVKKLRLTGGEPRLVRRNVMKLFHSLGRHLKTGALDELTLTTNGSQLARYAGELKAAASRASMSRSTPSTPRNSPPSPAGASCPR